MDYKTGLSNKMNVENMVSVITQKILQKYAGDASKEAINNAMDDFMAQH
jgi:hypothetical protein